jgi:hypothetical protein
MGDHQIAGAFVATPIYTAALHLICVGFFCGWRARIEHSSRRFEMPDGKRYSKMENEPTDPRQTP